MIRWAMTEGAYAVMLYRRELPTPIPGLIELGKFYNETRLSAEY